MPLFSNTRSRTRALVASGVILAVVTSVMSVLASVAPSFATNTRAVRPDVAVTSCSPSETTTLNTAVADATAYLADATDYFDAIRSGPRYTNWFGAFDQTRWNEVKATYQSIENIVVAGSIDFDCSGTSCGGGNVYAFSYPNDTSPYTVYLCGAFWTAPATGTDSRAGTLIHEWTHFNVTGTTDDHAYGKTGAGTLALSNPGLAVNNADNYEYFAENDPATVDNAPPPVATSLTPLSTPQRLFDTRAGVGGVSAERIGSADGTASALSVNVFGRARLPSSGIGAVVLNVTVTGGENPTVGGGYVTVYPCASGRPNASNLNFEADQTIPNSVIAPVDPAGNVCFYVYGKAHLVADVSGYFPTGSSLNALTPSRILDTRSGSKIGDLNGTGTPRTLNVYGQGGLPSSGIGAVVLNVTVTAGENPNVGGGYVTVYPCASGRPNASNLNFEADQTIPNSVIAPVDPAGNVCFYVYGKAHLLVDVSGYFASGVGLTALSPSRILDTRSGSKIGALNGTGTPRTLNVYGQGGLPSSGIGAVVLNVTVTGGEGAVGWVSVYPCASGRQETSNLNFEPGQTIPNSVIAPVDPSGNVCFYVFGKAHLLADVSGYFPA